MKAPTDIKVLKEIYKTYYNDFQKYTSLSENTRSSKIYVPVDCKLIAKKLKVDADIIFGRLYYHLEQKHGYTRADGSKVAFFSKKVGGDDNCVNFPLLVSVLAGLQEESGKFKLSIWLSSAAIVISVLALFLS
jgi:hypothetical protein